MEKYCSTGQSPQRAVAPTEEEVQVIHVFNGDAAVYEPPLHVPLIIHYGRCIVRMACKIASYEGSHGFKTLSRRLHILPDILQ
jgi:hypothetical protein